MAQPIDSNDMTAAFPGINGDNIAWAEELIRKALEAWRQDREAINTGRETRSEQTSDNHRQDSHLRLEMERALGELQTRFKQEVPTHRPQYIAHMKSDVSLPALLGWITALLYNSNVTSSEVSAAGAGIEREAIQSLARMIGFDSETARGHFTSGGTVANFEALWRARYRLDHWLALALYVSEKTGEALDPFSACHMGWERYEDLRRAHPCSDNVLRTCSTVAGNAPAVHARIQAAIGQPWKGPVILVPGNRHYSWQKAANLLGIGEEAFRLLALDECGRTSADAVKQAILTARGEGRPVMMVVGVAGSTEGGQVDPLDRVFNFLDEFYEQEGLDIWRHVDAAYGGFLCTLLERNDHKLLCEEVRDSLRAISRAHSVTIDPHKLGYTPYACGAFLARNSESYACSRFQAPYLEQLSMVESSWASTLEGSRPATGAAAVWMTEQSMGLGADGLGAVLASTVLARRLFECRIHSKLPDARIIQNADTNITLLHVARGGEHLSSSNQATRAIYENLTSQPGIVVSKTILGPEYRLLIQQQVGRYDGVADDEWLFAIRCVFMNPYTSLKRERYALADRFLEELQTALVAVRCSESLPTLM